MSPELSPLLQSVEEIKAANEAEAEQKSARIEAEINRMAIKSAIECAS